MTGISETAERFFREYLPEVLRIRHDDCVRQGGAIAFNIADAGKRWVIDFARAEVREDDSEATTIRMTSQDFDSLLAGTFDLARAADDNRWEFTGNPDDLTKLVTLFDFI